ncbi:MAG TPA: hypothetical protein V6C97_30240 [Oculatellaceae cyanobacterium]
MRLQFACLLEDDAYFFLLHIVIPVVEVEKPFTFWQALMIPGVIPYAICLLCSKLVNYSFLYWLPSYLSAVGMDKDTAGLVSTIFDIGLSRPFFSPCFTFLLDRWLRWRILGRLHF